MPARWRSPRTCGAGAASTRNGSQWPSAPTADAATWKLAGLGGAARCSPTAAMWLMNVRPAASESAAESHSESPITRSLAESARRKKPPASGLGGDLGDDRVVPEHRDGIDVTGLGVEGDHPCVHVCSLGR